MLKVATVIVVLSVNMVVVVGKYLVFLVEGISTY